MENQKAILDKIIETLKLSRDAWIGHEGEEARQKYKDGIDCAISSIEGIRLQSSFEEVARELMKHLAERHHPHCTVILTSTSAELVEGIQAVNGIYDYVPD